MKCAFAGHKVQLAVWPENQHSLLSSLALAGRWTKLDSDVSQFPLRTLHTVGIQTALVELITAEAAGSVRGRSPVHSVGDSVTRGKGKIQNQTGLEAVVGGAVHSAAL